MSKLIQRYSDQERLRHWATAIAFVLAALSGLAFFHPALYWLVNLFGGGPWTRILHPFLGVAMFVSFAFAMRAHWHHNRLTDADRQWLRQWRDVLANNEDKLPEVGRYNGGQKAIFWMMVVCTITLIVTGVIFWRPYFAYYFPIDLVRLATLLHAIAATVMIIGVIVHVYAAIWVKGSLRAMTRGTVSDAWARKYHAAWHREIGR